MFYRLPRIAVTVATALLVLTCFSANWAAQANLIAFIDDPDGTNHIYLMNPDGTNVTRLTTNDFAEGYVSWSPDGTQLVFEGYLNGVGAYIYDLA